jgi:hypothetical protein
MAGSHDYSFDNLLREIRGLKRLPASMYCQLNSIAHFDDEKNIAEKTLSSYSRGRTALCILPVLEDGQHYYGQCNFKRDRSAEYNFKFVNSFDNLCAQKVLSILGKAHSVDVFIFLAQSDMVRFESNSVHRAVAQKFELQRPLS